MEKIQVQDKIETILEIWREYKYGIGLKLYQIWRKYKYRIGLKLFQRYGEITSTG